MITYNYINCLRDKGTRANGDSEIGLLSKVGYSIPHLARTSTMQTNTFFDYVKLSFPVKFGYDFVPEGFECYTYPELKAILEMLLKLPEDPEHENVKDNIVDYFDETRLILYGNDSRAKFVHEDKEFDLRICVLELKGQGCRAFEERGGNILFDLIFPSYKRLNAICGRIDFDIDLINGPFTIRMFQELVEEGFLSTTFRNMNVSATFNIQGQVFKGEGLYFGSKSSTELLIYNKALEFAHRDLEVVNEIESYLRFEMRFFHEKADGLISHFLNIESDLKNNDELLSFESASILYKLLDFKDPNYDGNDTKKNRWPTWPMWLDFLGVVKKTPVKNQNRLEQTIAKKMNWQKKNLARQEAIKYLISMLDPSYKDFQNELLASGLDKIKKKELVLINRHLKKHGLSELTKNDVENLISSFNVSDAERYLNGEFVDGIDVKKMPF